MLLTMRGGWLDLLFIWSEMLLGLLNGMCVPSDRLRDTSRKFTICLSASIVILFAYRRYYKDHS